MRAILAALVGVIAWIAGPMLLFMLLSEYHIVNVDATGFEWYRLLSPASAILASEFRVHWGFGVQPFASVRTLVIVNLLWHGFVLYMFRILCLIHADRRLGRADDRRPQPVIPEAREVKVP
jgi:hypothetical protein